MLRIAVVGAGAIGRAHVAVLRGAADMALSAIADPSPAAAQLASECGVPSYATLQDLLQADTPDGVILATPNPLHVAQALSCMQAGVAVLVEKPIAHTVADARRLVQAVQQDPAARVLVGHHRAHSPIMAQARALVAAGRLGPLVCVSGSATFYKPDSYFSEAPWRKAPGGGPVLINLIHEIHNLRMLCGDIVAVQALASNATRGHAVEDSASIGLRFANGVLGNFMLSDCAASGRSWEQTSQENKAYASYADEDCYVISGTMGSLSVPGMRLHFFDDAASRSWFAPMQSEQMLVRRDDPLALQMSHFGRLICGEEKPLVSAADGLQNLLVVEAIAQAAASGQTVWLDDAAGAASTQ